LIIRAHVQTRAKIERVEEIGLEEYKIWVSAAPSDGEANQAVREILADYFDLPISLITIKSGNKSKHKLIEIDFPEVPDEAA
jgi:uncharacterized protein